MLIVILSILLLLSISKPTITSIPQALKSPCKSLKLKFNLFQNLILTYQQSITNNIIMMIMYLSKSIPEHKLDLDLNLQLAPSLKAGIRNSSSSEEISASSKIYLTQGRLVGYLADCSLWGR